MIRKYKQYANNVINIQSFIKISSDNVLQIYYKKNNSSFNNLRDNNMVIYRISK